MRQTDTLQPMLHPLPPEFLWESRTLVSHTSTTPTALNKIQLQGVLCLSGDSFPIHAFVDSGADGNFIYENFVKQHSIPRVPLDVLREVLAIDGFC